MKAPRGDTYMLVVNAVYGVPRNWLAKQLGGW